MSELTGFTCCGLAPFGYPAFPVRCPQPAAYLVWPKCEPPVTGYSYLCAAHLAALQRRGHPIYQINAIATGEVIFVDQEAKQSRRA